MRLRDVDRDTEVTFLHCLQDERPDDPRVMEIRRRWFENQRQHGLQAKVLELDSGEIAAMCQYVPIEQSHLVGEDLLAILCIWMHGYDHHIGNRQGNGYGRLILEAIERDAREGGFVGIAAWGMDFPYWNPVSFYEHMGYTRADTSGKAVLVWKALRDDAVPPRFLRPSRELPTDPARVSVVVFVNGWCMGACEEAVTVREAVEGLGDAVAFQEIDTSDPEVMKSWGVSEGLYVEGEPYRPYEPPWSKEVLRNDLIELARRKQGTEDGDAESASQGRGGK